MKYNFSYFSKFILFKAAVDRSALMKSLDDFILRWRSQRVSACIRFPCFEKCALISEKERSIIVVTVGHLRSLSAHLANFGKLFPYVDQYNWRELPSDWYSACGGKLFVVASLIPLDAQTKSEMKIWRNNFALWNLFRENLRFDPLQAHSWN